MYLMKDAEAYKAFRGIFLVIVVTICEILTPLFFILFLPLYVYSFLLRFLAPKFNLKMGKMLTSMSAMVATDDLYTRPLYTVLLNYFVDGEIDIEEHRRLFQTKIIDVRNSNGERRYPELRQHIENYWGHDFWVKDDSFDIKNHVRVCDKNEYFNLAPGQGLDEKALMKTTNEILLKPFVKKRSPWEILIFHGAKTESCDSPQQSLIIFRYHHAMSDGYSITKLMANVTTGKYFNSPQLQKELPLWAQILELALYPFRAMFAYICYLDNYMDKNSWSFIVDPKLRRLTPPSEKVKLRDVVYVCSETVPINKIKEIKRRRGASFNEILLEGISGGLRKYFLQHGPSTQPMHAALSCPVPGHPDKLTNHWTGNFIRLPTDLACPQRRLKNIQEQFKTFEMLVMSKIPYLGPIYAGSLFRKFVVYIMTHVLRPSTITLSIFPGPENLALLTGEKITSGGFVLGPMERQGVCMTIVSCNGALRIFFGIEKSLVKKEEDAQEIVENIANEFLES